MLEPEQYPQSFDKMVELVLAGQKNAAGLLSNSTVQHPQEPAAADPGAFRLGRDE
jgi:hypothetical protein